LLAGIISAYLLSGVMNQKLKQALKEQDEFMKEAELSKGEQ